LQRIKRAVDLDRVERARGKLELAMLWQILRIEDASPWLVAPAGNADANLGGHRMNLSIARLCAARSVRGLGRRRCGPRTRRWLGSSRFPVRRPCAPRLQSSRWGRC